MQKLFVETAESFWLDLWSETNMHLFFKRSKGRLKLFQGRLVDGRKQSDKMKHFMHAFH